MCLLSKWLQANQHAHYQFRIYRGGPDGAIEIRRVGAQFTETQALFDAAQEVLGWDVILQIERVEQALLPSR